MKKGSKLLTALILLLTAFFSLSAAIALPILWRGWYYGQAEALGLAASTGYSLETIRGAFDQVMDFLVKGVNFGVGELPWSQNGMSHFADCKILFQLDFVILTVTGGALLVLLLFALFSPGFRKKVSGNPPLWALSCTLLVFAIFGVWAFVDFDGLFAAFHTLCFPGKTNWIFDAAADPIILLLPEAFWLRTAGLVAVVTLGLEGLLALLFALVRRLLSPQTVYQQLLRDRSRWV